MNIRAGTETAVAIGTFDGVHLGHRRILRRTADVAQARSLVSTVLTYDPHPRSVFGGTPELLCSVSKRVDLIREQRIEMVIVKRFTREYASQSPTTFAREVLRTELGCRHVVVGSDFRFGHRREGNVDMLRELGETLGFEVDTIDVEEKIYSSTEIRRLAREGRLDEAALLLGRPLEKDGP